MCSYFVRKGLAPSLTYDTRKDIGAVVGRCESKTDDHKRTSYNPLSIRSWSNSATNTPDRSTSSPRKFNSMCAICSPYDLVSIFISFRIILARVTHWHGGWYPICQVWQRLDYERATRLQHQNNPGIPRYVLRKASPQSKALVPSTRICSPVPSRLRGFLMKPIVSFSICIWRRSRI